MYFLRMGWQITICQMRTRLKQLDNKDLMKKTRLGITFLAKGYWLMYFFLENRVENHLQYTVWTKNSNAAIVLQIRHSPV